MVDLQSRWTDYGVHTRAALGGGVLYSAPDLVQAQRVRRYGQKVISDLLGPFDALLTPTSGIGAPPLDGLTSESMLKWPSFTSIWNATGLPARAVPMGFTDDGLPLSLQIVGKPFDEATVLAVGDAYQQLTDWHLAVPPIAQLVPA
jgi:aspartyl-tRNA(Asn)/glutamyl-tRNA(Gln) amidotransferase subunit A